MARRPKPPQTDDQPTAPFWMATFSDMVTLLLAFFVMLVAMSEVEVKKFEDALSYFRGQTGMLKSPAMVPMMRPGTPTPPATAAETAAANEARYEELLERLREAGVETQVQVDLTPGGLHLTIADSVMFASGEATLLPAAERTLALVAEVIARDVQSVAVEGHTDDRPIATSRYPSNWELSAARAAAVVRFLLDAEDALEPARYQAAGFAEFRPRADNDTPEGRARNRRVEITLSTLPWQNPQTPTTP
ncbi:MAG: flagellar motor protein MotB [Rubricoccaceae bacterium]